MCVVNEFLLRHPRAGRVAVLMPNRFGHFQRVATLARGDRLKAEFERELRQLVELAGANAVLCVVPDSPSSVVLTLPVHGAAGSYRPTAVRIELTDCLAALLDSLRQALDSSTVNSVEVWATADVTWLEEDGHGTKEASVASSELVATSNGYFVRGAVAGDVYRSSVFTLPGVAAHFAEAAPC